MSLAGSDFTIPLLAARDTCELQPEDSVTDSTPVNTNRPCETDVPSSIKEINRFKLKYPKNMIISHYNINSIRYKFIEIAPLLEKRYFDILGIAESKIDNNFTDSLFEVQNYKLYRQDRNDRGGGIMLYVNDSLPHRVWGDVHKGIDYFIIEICVCRKKWYFIYLYRPPIVLESILTAFLHDICERYIDKGEVFVAFGDLNCNLIDGDSGLSDLCEVFSMKNIVTCPTCFKGAAGSLVDVFLTNRPKCFSGFFNVDLGISDYHNCIGVASRMHAPVKIKRNITYRTMKKFNEAKFLEDLNKIHIQSCNDSENIDDCYWAYEKSLLDVVNKHAPLKSKCIQGNQSPYMNSSLRKAINQRNMWRGKHFRSRADSKLRQKYAKWRNKVVRLRKQSIKYYIDKKCNGRAGTREFYKTLRPFFSDKKSVSASNNIILTDKENVITDPRHVAALFNTYYASIAEYPGISDGLDSMSLSDAIDKHAFHRSITNITGHIAVGEVFNFKFVSPECILFYISKLNVKKATGHDGLSPSLLKLSGPSICSSLSSIFNRCISNSTFPTSMKLADISPIFKKKDNLAKENYRSINVLTIISKVFERILCDQLLIYFEEIFSSHISAYRKGYNCQHVLLQITEHWRRALDRDEYVGTLSMDLSKAFDCMPHALLVAKLHAYGISLDACQLVTSYLIDRRQRVKISHEFSEWSIINRGVPQGSVLGPILFNIFVNDLFYIDIGSQIANYADDNNLYHSSMSLDDLTFTIQNDACAAVEWCVENHMNPNADKFQCTIMNRKGSVSAAITIQDSTINSADHISILGVKLDARLNFDLHVSDIVKRASKQINVLKRISKFLDEKSRINVYNTFIAANFNYCSVAWMFCGKKNSSKLEKIQTRALRFVFNDAKGSYHELLEKGNFLSLSAYRLYFLGIEVYKSKTNQSPNYIQDLFQSRNIPYRLRDCNKYGQSRFKTMKYGFRSFSYYGAKLWNQLPVSIKESDNLNIFKNRMKIWCRTDAGKKLEIC